MVNSVKCFTKINADSHDNFIKIYMAVYTVNIYQC